MKDDAIEKRLELLTSYQLKRTEKDELELAKLRELLVKADDNLDYYDLEVLKHLDDNELDGLKIKYNSEKPGFFYIDNADETNGLEIHHHPEIPGYFSIDEPDCNAFFSIFEGPFDDCVEAIEHIKKNGVDYDWLDDEMSMNDFLMAWNCVMNKTGE